jgi:hypothetical protein
VQLAAAVGSASLLAGVNVRSLISSAPVHAAASCEHHSGGELRVVHSRWPKVRVHPWFKNLFVVERLIF